MKLRVGLVGLGNAWQDRHAPALRALGDYFEVRAVCEQVTHRAEQAAEKFGAVAVDGFRALVQRDDVDAVLMLAPQWYGVLPILAACDAGKAVYCAVALNVEMEEARQLKQRIQQSNICFVAELPKRHAPATIRLKELIATHLGAPRLLFCHRRQPVESKSSRASQGPVPPMHDLVEQVDLCRFVVGHEAKSIVSVAHSCMVGSESHDYQMLSIDFGSSGNDAGHDVLAQISCGHYIPCNWPEAISFRPPAALQVACENGIAFLDLPATVVWYDDAGRHRESLESERPVTEQILSQFYRLVSSRRLSTDVEDAYRAMSIVLAGRTSQTEGRRVELEF